MPFSSDSGKAYIQQIVKRIQPKTGLDIGCGSGTYAKLFPTVKWAGVEVWSPYAEKYDLSSLYDPLLLEDARTLELDGHWDIGVAGDVLEHMTREEAHALLRKMLQSCRYVIVSIPLGHYPQDEYDGNPFERHVKDDWTHNEVLAAFGDPLQHRIENEIGVYVYGNDPLPRLKICVYAISKNEEKFVERFCKAARPADLILIADTGSTDRTTDIAIQCGATVHDIFISPWRFDLARNAALALIPRDIDVCISLDLDEELQPGWREEIERVWVEGTTRLRYKFDWGAGIVFYYEKIHARHGYRWHHPCHEYPVPDRITEQWAQTDMLLAIHKPDPTKSRGQYLDLLRVSIEEDPQDPRNAFYYARELSFHRLWSEAIRECERYLALPNATWENERCYAMRVIARCYNEMGDKQAALNWARRATAEAPNTREPWCEVANIAYQMGRWSECYGAAMSALEIQHRELVYTCDPEVWGHQPHDLASIAAWNLGLKDEAVAQARLALEKSPVDLRLQQNLGFMIKAA